jgi:chromosome partitioning protein
MAVISVFNQKGGVGKTTTILNVGAALAARGRRPVLIDLDPQASLSLAMGVRAVQPSQSVYAHFQDGKPLAALIRSQASGVRLIPSSLELSKVEALHGSDPAISRKLKEGLDVELASAGSPILIDCCPMLGVLTLNALLAADRVLMPVSADYLSLEGVHKLDAALGVLEKRLGKQFQRRVLVTRFDARRRLSFEIHRQLQARFPETICRTVITETVSLAESPMHGKDIFAYAPHSQGAKDYQALTDELEAGNFFG